MPIDYGTVLEYSDRGFGFVSRTLTPGTKVFFHIKTIRRKYPQLAERVDKGSHSGVGFWYDTQWADRGDQVRDLWLKVDEIPEPQRAEVRATFERMFDERQILLPTNLEKLAQEVLGPTDYEKLHGGWERRLREKREAEAERQRMAQEQQAKAAAQSMERQLSGNPPVRADEEAEALRIVEVEAAIRNAEEHERLTREAARQVPPAPVSPPSTGPAPSTSPPPPAESGTQADWWIKQIQAGAVELPTPEPGPRQIETKVVGVTYEGRQGVVRLLSVDEEVLLRREPTNPHDRNAIRVERKNGQQIGYIGRVLAAAYAPLFDAHGGPVPATVKQLPGGESALYSLGVRIRFFLPEAGGAAPLPVRDFDDE